MSSIATFRLVPVRVLPGLLEALAVSNRRYDAYLGAEAGAAVTFPWSGTVMATVLPYLDEQGIGLMRCEHEEIAAQISIATQTTTFLLTARHRDEYLSRLDASSFPEDDLRDFFNSFYETDEPEVGRPMRDGIRALREVLEQLTEENVALLKIA